MGKDQARGRADIRTMITIDLKKIDLPPGSRVLDLGCGEGRHGHALLAEQDLHVAALDLDLDSLGKAREGFQAYFPDSDAGSWSWNVFQGNCLKLPFKDQSFDCIVCSEVLEHLPDYHSALKEIQRTLNSGGLFVLSVPRYWPERICWALSRDYQHDPGGHVRIFKKTPLRLEVERLGFRHVAGHGAHALHCPYWWLKCLNWERRETWLLIRLYHAFLLWDMFKAPRLTRWLEKALNPMAGKSVTLYFDKVVPK